MAKTILSSFKKFSWQESYASLVLGAIIIVVIGFLVANFITRRNQIGEGEQTFQSQEEALENSQSTQEYRILAGDSLSLISEKFYKTQEFWPVLAKVNNITNPNIIFVDSTIKVPPKSEAANIQSQMTMTSYKIQQGDTLFSIAQNVYGDGSMWTVLDRANGVGRLPNGNPLIFADNVLVIPR